MWVTANDAGQLESNDSLPGPLPVVFEGCLLGAVGRQKCYNCGGARGMFGGRGAPGAFQVHTVVECLHRVRTKRTSTRYGRQRSQARRDPNFLSVSAAAAASAAAPAATGAGPPARRLGGLHTDRCATHRADVLTAEELLLPDRPPARRLGGLHTDRCATHWADVLTAEALPLQDERELVIPCLNRTTPMAEEAGMNAPAPYRGTQQLRTSPQCGPNRVGQFGRRRSGCRKTTPWPSAGPLPRSFGP
jgi:hypothetical protein